MNQIPKDTYTKEDIVRYVEGMEIKKTTIGGYDKVDVYVQIQELLKMYSAYMDSELDKQQNALKQQEEQRNQKIQHQKEEIAELLKYKTLAEQLRKENEVQKQEIAELRQKIQKQDTEIAELIKKDSAESTLESLELKSELRKQTEEISELKNQLNEYQNLVSEQKQMIQEQSDKIQEAALLKDEIKQYQTLLAERPESSSDDIQEQLKAQKEIIMKKDREIFSVTQKLKDQELKLRNLREWKEKSHIQNTQNNQSSQGTHNIDNPENYNQEIGAILREARKEADNIINNSRMEAEQEMIRLLNLRAKYSQEKEIYESWCRQVNKDQKSIEEFYELLASQYQHVDSVLSSIKERTSAFNYKGIGYHEKEVE